MSTVGLVLVAAGSGSRLGLGVPKALVRIDGVTILERALGVVPELNVVAVSIAAPPAEIDSVRSIVDSVGVSARVVAGGNTRMASVAAALAALPAVDIVLIHDVARPYTPAEVFQRVIAEVDATNDGVIPALPVIDTTVVAEDRVVTETTDRSTLFRVQTPQGFPGEQFRAAISATLGDFTDDASVWRAHGGTVRLVDGDERSAKITTETDLTALGVGGLIGLGTDTHAFDDSVPLRLGLLDWPGEPGLSGHSDGDAVAHALCDALLSAAGLGDIGTVFGTDDPRYRGASGGVFLTETVKKVVSSGFRPISASVEIVANRPKIGPRRSEIEKALTAVLGIPVSVSATTTDGLGFTGEGKGISALAVAHLARQ